MPAIWNIAAYRFVTLTELASLRQWWLAAGESLGVRGTILLSAEGINLFLAGPPAAVRELLAVVEAEPGLAELPLKESWSERLPFARYRVRIRPQIIPFDEPRISPERHTSRRLAPAELKAWLDAGRRVILLDTRNDFESDHGTFVGAARAGLGDFRQFTSRAAEFPEDWKSQPVVTFCTGGIRCEKAAPYLESLGYREVYQLDGGILNYFETCGGAYYRGNCFVFDERVALTPELKPVRDI